MGKFLKGALKLGVRLATKEGGSLLKLVDPRGKKDKGKKLKRRDEFGKVDWVYYVAHLVRIVILPALVYKIAQWLGMPFEDLWAIVEEKLYGV